MIGESNDTGESLEEILFDRAVQKATAAERAAFLDSVCRDNPGLRAALEELLQAHFGAAGFLPKRAASQTRAAIMPSPPSPPAEAPAQMLGRYKLLEKIGEGGFGEVWMAEQREPVKRRVALKIIKLGMDTRQVIARFEAERQALAMMDHPNIARIFDGGVTEQSRAGVPPAPAASAAAEHVPASNADAPLVLGRRDACPAFGRPYFVMELVRGSKITDYCDQNQLPTLDRLKLFILVC